MAKEKSLKTKREEGKRHVPILKTRLGRLVFLSENEVHKIFITHLPFNFTRKLPWNLKEKHSHKTHGDQIKRITSYYIT
jgi:hypothetical protein